MAAIRDADRYHMASKRHSGGLTMKRREIVRKASRAAAKARGPRTLTKQKAWHLLGCLKTCWGGEWCENMRVADVQEIARRRTAEDALEYARQWFPKASSGFLRDVVLWLRRKAREVA